MSHYHSRHCHHHRRPQNLTDIVTVVHLQMSSCIGSCRKPCGNPMEILWEFHLKLARGIPSDEFVHWLLQETYGIPMDVLWKSYGFPMGNHLEILW